MGKYYLHRLAATGMAFLLFVVSLAGCSQKEQPEEETAGMYWISDGLKTVSDKGVFYQDDNNFLRFQDVDSGLDVLICDKPDCEHNRESCPAYFDAIVYGVAWDEDGLLVVTDEGADRYGELFIYETAENGGERKQIAAYDNMQTVMNVLFTEEIIVISYYNQYDENLEWLDTFEAGIVVYDRNTGESRTIWSKEGWNAMAYMLSMFSGEISFYALYYDLTEEEVTAHESDSAYLSEHLHMEAYLSDIEGENVRLIKENVMDMGADGERIYYRVDDIVYVYDPGSGSEQETAWDVSGFYHTYAEGQQIMAGYDSETKEILFYVYEDETGTIRYLGASQQMPIYAVFDNVTYAYVYNENYEGLQFAYCSTEDFLKGNFDMFQEFEKE